MSLELLIRDDLTDNGQVVIKKHYSQSPDIILHEKITNPADFLKWSYNHDVSQILPPCGGRMPVYVRVKNMGSQPVSGYVYLYWTEPELFMFPSLWKYNRLCIEDGSICSPIQSVEKDQIGICTHPFWLNVEKGRRYSLIAIVQEDNVHEPKIPNFGDYSEFVEWVKKDKCISMRCMDIVQKDVLPEGIYTNFLHIHTPEGAPKQNYIIRISLNDVFPANSRLTLSSPLFDGSPLTKLVTVGYKELTWDIPINCEIAGYSGVIDLSLQMPFLPLQGEGMVAACIGIVTDGVFIQLGQYSARIIE
ncbi:MAG: hypothetical protein RRZ63_09925 [Clostridium sp.]